ncbi:copper transport protein [Nocardioides sp. BE266]|uniref:copper resistance CopC/CopD family protein n=1 Tax=Nocardioides sp. BE266 TaxID=2817725 RepID=UPI00285661C0|nr:CopD family protein [Nocardioides sp. BE266]MDR7251301.1 copper transport protein [Nocardioides sp. BE266]
MTSVVVRRAAGWLLLLPLACVLLLGAAAPASAHATLIGTDPVEGAVLDTAPDDVTFTFNESVIGVPAGIRVFDATGEEVASSATVRDAELVVHLDEEVDEGTLVVVWRLVSEDGHPIGGSLTFSVGAPSDVVDVPTTSADADTTAPLPLSVVRWLGYLGLLVATGAAIFAVLFLPAGRDADGSRRRLRAAVRPAAGLAALGWLLAVPLVALYQLGVGASALGDGSTWSALAPMEYVVPAAVVAGLVLVALALPVREPDGARRALVLAGCVVALAAPAFTGHTRAASPEALVVAVDVLHLVAGAVWLGGLVAVALVLADLAARDDSGAVALSRFSTCASAVLAVLLVTGTLGAWRIAGSWGALLDTGYGGLLLVKFLLVLVAVAIAAWNRFSLLPGLRDASRRRERRDAAGLLVRTTLAEAGVLVAVLLVTGFLVDRSPEVAVAADASSPGAASAGESVELGELTGEVTLEPVAVGPTTVTIELTDDAGRPAEGFEAPRLSLSTDGVDLGAVSLSNQGPGVYSGDVVIPTAGAWEVQVSLRTTEFDNPVKTIVFDVR